MTPVKDAPMKFPPFQWVESNCSSFAINGYICSASFLSVIISHLQGSHRIQNPVIQELSPRDQPMYLHNALSISGVHGRVLPIWKNPCTWKLSTPPLPRPSLLTPPSLASLLAPPSPRSSLLARLAPRSSLASLLAARSPRSSLLGRLAPRSSRAELLAPRSARPNSFCQERRFW